MRLSLSKKYIAFMQIDEKVFHDFISKRKTTIHISSVLNARRFAPHVYLPRIVVPNIKNKRNSHFIGLQTDFSRSVLPFWCELRLLVVTDYAIAAQPLTVSLRYFASAEATKGFALDTHHPLNKAKFFQN